MEMTDKIQQARRELFETWTKSEHGNISRRQDGEYFDDLTYGAWLGFNAALDCVVIELPKPISEHNTDVNGFVNPAAEEYDGCLEDCRDAIKSTNLGIKVK